VSLQRENCIHRFDAGFFPKICENRDGIIVTRSSPLISVVTRKGPGEYRILGDPSEEAAEYLARSPHRAHLMRLTLELGWDDDIGKLLSCSETLHGRS
jgi:hypothetical protein